MGRRCHGELTAKASSWLAPGDRARYAEATGGRYGWWSQLPFLRCDDALAFLDAVHGARLEFLDLMARGGASDV